MDAEGPRRRILFVHAHPDDETINNGATMAFYAAAGAHVCLVTCTRGEQGEVIPARLAHLVEQPPSGEGGLGFETGPETAGLGSYRVGELTAAMEALGVLDHRFLGDPAAPGRVAVDVLADGGTVFADSGMAYDRDGGVVPSPNPPAGAFALTETDSAARLLAAVIEEVRPQVVVTYEPGGGYGHPDHVQAHLVTMRAVELAAGSVVDAARTGAAGTDAAGLGWAVPKVYWAVLPSSVARQGFSDLAQLQGADYRGPDPDGRLPSMVMPDELVTAAIDAEAFVPAKLAALRAHETQILVSPDHSPHPYLTLSNGASQPVLGTEYYRLVRGRPAAPYDQQGRETDLFAGLA